jgi:tellurite methyltransferase
MPATALSHRPCGHAIDTPNSANGVCLRCQQLEAPPELEHYKSTPEFSAKTLPKVLTRDHQTKAGVWGQINVLEGRVIYRVTSPFQTDRMLLAGDVAMIVPESLHHLEPESADFRVCVDFLRLRLSSPEKR